MNLAAFKAYDIRGKYPKEVNEELAYLVGRALVRYLSAKNIVVGMDMRLSSQSLKEKIIEGISCEGADVFDIGLCTTPMVNFTVINYGYDGAVMISASHDPGDENGIKLIDSNGIQIGEDFGLVEIREIVTKGFTTCPGKGAITEKDILSEYLAYLTNFFSDLPPKKIVVDYSNGVGSIPAKPFFARTDLEVIELNIEPDGTFPVHSANPHDKKNLDQLCRAVIAEGADLGFFFDGDADRVQVVDESGKIIPMDLLFLLLVERELQISKNKGKEFYFDLRFSKVVPEKIAHMGGKPVMMRVGNPYYKKALSESGVMAAEFSGHVMFKENKGVDDGLFCALKTLSLLDTEIPISQKVSTFKKYETSEEVSVESRNPQNVLDNVSSLFCTGKRIEIDGLYIDLPDGFVSVRRSQTEPSLFRIRVEAKTKKELHNRLNSVLRAIAD